MQTLSKKKLDNERATIQVDKKFVTHLRSDLERVSALTEELTQKLLSFEVLFKTVEDNAIHAQVAAVSINKLIEEFKGENERNSTLLLDSNAKLIEILSRYSNPK